MIGWLQPSALWALTLLIVPVAIHLLRARRARRVPFPTIRFVPPSRTAAVRLRLPSDLLLLAVRMGIVALAVSATAGPLWLSSSRLAGWNSRMARAVVVDASESMRAPRADGRTPADAAREAAEAEQRDAMSWRVEHPDLEQGIRRAAAWLRSAPPARREIVVISDFQLGSVSRAVLNDVAQDVGVRFIRVDGAARSRSIEGMTLLGVPGRPRRVQQVELSGQGTRASLTSPAASPTAQSHGLRLLDAGDERESDRLLATLAEAGTAAPDQSQPITVRFAPIGDTGDLERLSARWMIDAAARLERSFELVRLTRDVDAAPLPESAPAAVLMRDRSGRPLVRAAARDRELVLDVATPISSYFAAALTRAALGARRGAPGRPEAEVMRIADSDLSTWSRAPNAVGPSAWRQSQSSDARWIWAGALILLGFEQWLRSAARARKDEERAAA